LSLQELFHRGVLRSRHGGQTLRFTFASDASTADIVRRLAQLYSADRTTIHAAIRESRFPRAS
jgi:hypothetical protein